MAEAFKPLTADMQSLIRQNYGFIDIPVLDDPGASTRYNVNRFAAHIEVVRPSKKYGKFMLVWQLQETRDAMLNLLRSYGRIVRDEMKKPTDKWIVRPMVHAGVPGKPNSKAVPVNLSRATTEVSTGAYVEASGEHSKWIPRQEGDAHGWQDKTENDAAWHYIWANAGTRNRHIFPRADGQATQIVFLGNYHPSTSANSLHSAAASRRGPIVRKPFVATNSVKPRKFLDLIVKEQTPKFHQACMAAIGHAIEKYFDHNAEEQAKRKFMISTTRS